MSSRSNSRGDSQTQEESGECVSVCVSRNFQKMSDTVDATQETPVNQQPQQQHYASTDYAQNVDEHIAVMLQNVLAQHNEWCTVSHMQWLHRQYSRVLVRSLELDRREQELVQRERALANTLAKKSNPNNRNRPRRPKPYDNTSQTTE